MHQKTTRQPMTTESQLPSPACLHVANGRIQIPKICIRGYECLHCVFDQWIEEMETMLEETGNSKVAGTVPARAA